MFISIKKVGLIAASNNQRGVMIASIRFCPVNLKAVCVAIATITAGGASDVSAIVII